MSEQHGRWRGAVAGTLVLAGAGVWTGDGTLLVAAALPLVYLAYGSVATVGVPDDLTVERRVDPSPAPPGAAVTVTLSVTNDTDRPLSDVRVVDGVPRDLAVVDGSPRLGTALDAGETAAVEYSLVARRGDYEFDSPRIRVRGTGAGAVATVEREPSGERRLVCRLDADAPPLSDRGGHRVGQSTSDDPGAGLTFHSTREYRRGDPASRIDWRQYAKQGRLATVNYDRWVSTTVVLVVDARAPCRVAAGPGRPTGAELGAYAATRALNALLRAGHDVGVAVVGVDGDGPAGLAWLPPGGGREQRSRAVSLLGDAVGDPDVPEDGPNGDGTANDSGGLDGIPDGSPGLDGIPDGSPGLDGIPDGSSGLDGIPDGSTGLDGVPGGGAADDAGRRTETGSGGGSRRRSAPGTQFRKAAELAGRESQLVLVSPLLDDAPVGALDDWAAMGRTRTVVSPDVVPSNTVSGQFDAVARRTRLARCQTTGARTIDWRRGTPLGLVIEYAFAVDARESGAAAGGTAAGGGV